MPLQNASLPTAPWRSPSHASHTPCSNAPSSRLRIQIRRTARPSSLSSASSPALPFPWLRPGPPPLWRRAASNSASYRQRARGSTGRRPAPKVPFVGVRAEVGEAGGVAPLPEAKDEA